MKTSPQRRVHHIYLRFPALCALVWGSFILAGCQTVPGEPRSVADGAPTYAELADAHNRRVQQLSRVYARGVIEVAWRDEDNRMRRFPQSDVDLYLDLPRQTALRAGKLGDTYLWLGSDDEHYWLFDLLEDERVLYTGRHDEAHALYTVHPFALLDLIGMGPLRALEDEPPQVRFDSGRKAWVVQSWGSGGPVRLFFDRTTRLPTRIEALNSGGEVISHSTIHMHRYRSVPVAGISAAAQPRMATLIDIVSTGAEGVAEGEIKLALDSPTGRVDDQPFDRVFDLERLKRSLRPTRIEGE